MKKILALLLFSILLFGCIDTTAEKASNSQNTDQKSIQTTNLTLQLGESLIVDKELKVTVLDGTKTEYYSYKSSTGDQLSDFSPEDQKFYIFSVEFANIGQDNAFYFDDKFLIVDQEGNVIKPDFYVAQDSLSSGELISGTKKKGRVVFKVPNTIVKPTLVYDYSNVFDSNAKISKWELNKLKQLDYSPQGTITIDKVESSLKHYSFGDSGNIGNIEFTIKNTGVVGFEPKVSYKITNNNKIIAEDDASLFTTTIIEGKSQENTIILFTSIESGGNYNIQLTLKDKRTEKEIANTTKTINIS